MSVVGEETSKGYTLLRGQRYNFYQLHWLTPSEHTIDGESFPLEAHFVHQLDDQQTKTTSSLVGTLSHLVMGVLYEMSDECNEQLDEFWSLFPLSPQEGMPTAAASTPDLNKLLADTVAGGYYWYAGSLTTPPCTEGVSWKCSSGGSRCARGRWSDERRRSRRRRTASASTTASCSRSTSASSRRRRPRRRGRRPSAPRWRR